MKSPIILSSLLVVALAIMLTPATVSARAVPATSRGTLGYDTSENNATYNGSSTCNTEPTGLNTFVVAQVADVTGMHSSGGAGAGPQADFVSCLFGSVQAPESYIFLGDAALAQYTAPSYCSSYWPNPGTPPTAWCLGLDEAMYSYDLAVNSEDPTYHCLWYDGFSGCIEPVNMVWWLDVEPGGWGTNKTYNQDVFDGAHYFLYDVLGIVTGLYSFSSGWSSVTGPLDLSSVGLPEWVASNACTIGNPGCPYDNGGTNWESVHVLSSSGWSPVERLDMDQWCSNFQAGNSIWTPQYVEYGPFANEPPSDVKYSQGIYEAGGYSDQIFYSSIGDEFDGDMACY